jgi:beta-N-acetylhexosaminidase
LGDVAVDTHHGAAIGAAGRSELERRELVPFAAAIAAGARLAMAGHLSVPALTGEATLPASLSAKALGDVLRTHLGFKGVTITDAVDMAAVASNADVSDPMAAALEAGEDLLLGTPKVPLLDLAVDVAADSASTNRLAALRGWLAGFDQPDLSVVGCAEHQALAAELAARSVTLVRDDDGLLPLRLVDGARVLVIEPQPADLTPADTTSVVAPTLAAAVRRRHARTDELITSSEPAADEIAAVRERASGYDLVVLGTVAAHLQRSHAELARAVLAAARPTITVALRTPWDLGSYPHARTHAATYGCLAPCTDALVAALFGERDFSGRLPVNIGLYPRGHGLRLGAAASHR